MSDECWAYCWPQSVTAGDGVELRVSSEAAVDVTVLRVAGVDRGDDVVVHEQAGVAAVVHGFGENAFATGCDWPTALRLDTAGWEPGVHLVSVRPSGLPVADGRANAWAYVVVRPSAPRARRVLMMATNTWNAYNDVGGENLYTRSVRQSYRRPLPPEFLRKEPGAGERFAQVAPGQRRLDDFRSYSRAHGTGGWHGAAGFATYDERFLRWCAAADIGIDVVLDRDVHAEPGLLAGYDIGVSVGHDEYTTWEQRDALEAFVASGRRLVFLSGNAHYWQVRVETDVEPADAMACFKHRYEEDPVFAGDDRSRLTSIWSDPLIGRPENRLTGVSFTRGGYARMADKVRHGSGGYRVHRPEHRLLEGTGLAWGDELGADHTVVGYECDGCDMALVDGRPVPTGIDGTPSTFEIVATAPAEPFDERSTLAPLADGGRWELEWHAEKVLGDTTRAAQERLRWGHAVLGEWTHESGGRVCTTGCTDWVFGLADETIATITRTMLDA
ncbi:MAG: N,N-dimethylformamidase beta subunit family domain-containing protein [Actinomycetota bacterium]